MNKPILAIFLVIIVTYILSNINCLKNTGNSHNVFVANDEMMKVLPMNTEMRSDFAWIKVGEGEYITSMEFNDYKNMCDSNKGLVVKFKSGEYTSKLLSTDDKNIWSVREYEAIKYIDNNKFKNIINKNVYYRADYSGANSRGMQWLYFFPTGRSNGGWAVYKMI
jgi:hypothetical protein